MRMETSFPGSMWISSTGITWHRCHVSRSRPNRSSSEENQTPVGGWEKEKQKSAEASLSATVDRSAD